MSKKEEPEVKEKIADQEAQQNESTENAEETTENSQEETVEQTEGESVNEFEEKYTEVNDKYLRLYSEFENFRKRTAKEKLDLIMNASEGMMSALLPILDDLERAIKSNEESTDIEAVKEGINLVSQKLTGILASKGLKPMEVEAGADFDLDIHEAITKIPAPSDELKGKVVDAVEKGYFLNEKVIRYTKVVIGE
ncbi:MAG: nucleotide exchange factor GrpE [Flavobacteriales bacterium]|jgi:molecular chaperone GrpE|nr:nucleotide exchange factor GrpE [Flavobacteriales bacterium]